MFYLRLNQNPVAQSEYSHLKQSHSLRHWGYLPLYGLFFLGVMGALIPFLLYITIDYTRLLFALMLLIFSIHFFICGRTVLLAAHAITHDWDTVVVSGATARQIVRGKCWAVARHVWPWFVFAALLKFGLALGLAQHVYSGAYHDSFSEYFALLDYPSLGYATTPTRDPSFLQGVFALLILIGFGLLQALLMSALGVLCGLIARRRHVAPAFIAITVYVLLVGLIGAITINAQGDIRYKQRGMFYGNHYYSEMGAVLQNVLQTHILKYAGIDLLSLIDGETWFSADVLRPVGTEFHHHGCLINCLIGATLYWTVILIILRSARRLAAAEGASALIPNLRQRLLYWIDNPVTRIRYKKHRFWHIFMLVILSISLAIAWIPQWKYIDASHTSILRLIIGVTAATHIILILQTFLFASQILDRERDSITWDCLIIAGVDSRRLVLGKWWITIRENWPYYILFTGSKLGLACGLLQYLYFTPIYSPHTHTQLFFGYLIGHFDEPYSFVPKNIWEPYTYYPYPNQALWSFLQTGIILALFSLLEGAFASALGVATALISRKSIFFSVTLAFLSRAFLVGLVILFLYHNPTLEAYYCHYDCTSQDPYFWIVVRNEENRHIVDTLEVAASTQFDGGMASLNLVKLDYRGWYGLPISRQYIGLGLGAASYIFLIWLTLWAAQKVAIRRGALPPPDW